MKDASTAVRTAYKTLLAGLTVDGKAIKLYTGKAPDGAARPYLIVLSQQSLPDNTKNSFGQVHRLTLSAVTEGFGNDISNAPGENIINAVLGRLFPQAERPEVVGLPQQEGFEIYAAEVESIDDLPTETKTGYVTQKIVSIRHLININ